MVICSSILLVCFFAMFPVYSRKTYWKWIGVLVILLCSIFFFYTPNRAEDLYRYYQVMASVRPDSNITTLLVDTYMQETPLFLIYAKILSIFPNNVLPFVTGVISFFLYIKLLKKAFSENDAYSEGYRWQIVMCLIVLLFLIRFLDVTSIRNILATAIFSVAIYDDLVEHKKRSIALYIITVLIHSAALMYLLIRIVLWLYGRYNKIVVLVLMLAASTLIINFSDRLAQIFLWSPAIQSLFSRLMHYMNNGSGMVLNERYRLLYAVMYIFILAIALCYEKGFDVDKKYGKLTDFMVLLTAFTFSFINHRELFNRNRMVLIPIGLFFFAQLLKQISGSRMGSVILYNNSNKKNYYYMGSSLVYLFFAFSVAYFVLVTRSDYTYFNRGFRL